MPATYDVIILGLGGMGSAAAFHLAARGKRVLGLERFGPAHDRGSSHGDSRIIRQAYHEHPDYVPLAQRAYELWRRLERDADADILRQVGGLMIGRPGSHVVEGAILSATRHNLPHEVWDAKELRRRFPVFHPRDDETALYEEIAGYVRPEIAIQTHLQLAAKQGAELRFEEAVMDWSAHGSGVTVKTTAGQYLADHLVIAPGAWAPGLLADLGISFHVRRHVMCWFESLSQQSSFPIYIWDVDGKHCFYGFPTTGTLDGAKVGMHSGGDVCQPQNVDRVIREGDVSEVRDCLARFIPELNGKLARAVTCLYTMTPDEHFVVGLHPRHPQVSVAAGFSGHGFKFSSVMGEILADLAISGQTSQPIGFLSPNRYIEGATEHASQHPSSSF